MGLEDSVIRILAKPVCGKYILVHLVIGTTDTGDFVCGLAPFVFLLGMLALHGVQVAHYLPDRVCQ